MKRTLALLAVLTLAAFSGLQAEPAGWFCHGDVYYGGQQLTTYTVQTYNSPVNYLYNYDPSFEYSPDYYFGSYHWETGTYYVCIHDASNHWYHITINHTFGQSHFLGSVTLSSSTHPKHLVSSE